ARFDELVAHGTERQTSAPTRSDGEDHGQFVQASASVSRRGIEDVSKVQRMRNAATRAAERIHTAWNAGDWTRFAAVFPPTWRNIDRRAMIRLEAIRDEYLEAFQPLFAIPALRERTILASRGDRLELGRDHWKSVDGAIGPVEVAFLAIIEVDAVGDPVTT